MRDGGEHGPVIKLADDLGTALHKVEVKFADLNKRAVDELTAAHTDEAAAGALAEAVAAAEAELEAAPLGVLQAKEGASLFTLVHS